METYLEMQNWVLNEVNDTSSAMRGRVQRNIHNIMTDTYLGVDYDWNMNVTTMALSSGVSSIALPSPMIRMGKLWNETYSCRIEPKNKAQMSQYPSSDGILRSYYRIGSSLVFPQISGTQNVYLEWFPPFASLASDGAIPLCPDTQVIKNGAAWLTFEGLEKSNKADRFQQAFAIGVQQLRGESDDELVSIIDSGTYIQEE